MKENQSFILAFDLGTTGLKAALFDQELSFQASTVSQYKTHHREPGWAEQDPEDWWQAVRSACTDLLAANPDARNKIQVIGICGHMLGCLAVDTEGNPLRPAIIHSDNRAVSECEALSESLGAEYIYRLTGNQAAAQSPLCKIMWLKANEPDSYKRSQYLIQSKDFLSGRLTAKWGHSDYSDASHSSLYDIHEKKWAEDLLKNAGISIEKMPEVKASADIVGRLTKKAAHELGLVDGIPVVAGGGDGACATAGAGVRSDDRSYLNIGSSAWFSSLADEPYIDPERQIFNIIGLDPNTTGIYCTTESAGGVHSWAVELFADGDYSAFDNMVESSKLGSRGLLFFPWLDGERSPLWDPYAKGVFFGLGYSHRKADMARAVLEGLSLNLKSNFLSIGKVVPVEALRLVGGGAKSPLWRQMLADVFGIALSIPGSAEQASSFGAAMAAAVGAGIFSDYDNASRSISLGPSTEAIEGHSKEYKRLHAFFEQFYPGFKERFRELSRFRQGKS